MAVNNNRDGLYVVWYKFSYVSEDHTASSFRVEEEAK